MSTSKIKQLAKRQALGTTFAAAPPMKEMQMEVTAWFADGVPEDEIRRRLCEAAVHDEQIGLRPFLRLPRKAMRMRAADALVEVAKFYAAKLGKKKTGQVLADWAASIGSDRWLADYHIAWYKTGTPPPLGERLFGGVTRIVLGPEGESPIVVAVAGSVSDPEAIIEEFRRRCYREFPQAFARKEHAERDAERVRRFENEETDFQIARDELEAEGWSVSAVTKTEYNQGVRSRANSITHARKRWLEYVTNIGESPSPSSD
jgi:hypothetical protein